MSSPNSPSGIRGSPKQPSFKLNAQSESNRTQEETRKKDNLNHGFTHQTSLFIQEVDQHKEQEPNASSQNTASIYRNLGSLILKRQSNNTDSPSKNMSKFSNFKRMNPNVSPTDPNNQPVSTKDITKAQNPYPINESDEIDNSKATSEQKMFTFATEKQFENSKSEFELYAASVRYENHLNNMKQREGLSNLDFHGSQLYKKQQLSNSKHKSTDNNEFMSKNKNNNNNNENENENASCSSNSVSNSSSSSSYISQDSSEEEEESKQKEILFQKRMQMKQLTMMFSCASDSYDPTDEIFNNNSNHAPQGQLNHPLKRKNGFLGTASKIQSNSSIQAHAGISLYGENSKHHIQNQNSGTNQSIDAKPKQYPDKYNKQQSFFQSFRDAAAAGVKQSEESSVDGSDLNIGGSIFSRKRKPSLISNFIEKRKGIKVQDVEINDSFDHYNEDWISVIENNSQVIKNNMVTENHTSQPFNRQNQPLNQRQSPKQVNQIRSRMASDTERKLPYNKIYCRSSKVTYAERTGDEKPNVTEVVEQSDDCTYSKHRVHNKEILSSFGVIVHSEKGNEPDNLNNMTDYFVYEEINMKLLAVIAGHGAYGSSISNLASRLLFKHFFNEPLIKQDPVAGLKRLFGNVDKFISQHITFFDLENNYNQILSGACCSLVFVKNNTLYVASLGNTNALLFRQLQSHRINKLDYVRLSANHLPSVPEERVRIQMNTGEVRSNRNEYIDRVFVRGRTFPGIEITRCFGNEIGKMVGVICEPDINIYELHRQTDLFLIVTTPKFFDYISQEEVYFILCPYSQKTASRASEALLKRIKQIQTQSEAVEDLTFVVQYFI